MREYARKRAMVEALERRALLSSGVFSTNLGPDPSDTEGYFNRHYAYYGHARWAFPVRLNSAQSYYASSLAAPIYKSTAPSTSPEYNFQVSLRESDPAGYYPGAALHTFVLEDVPSYPPALTNPAMTNIPLGGTHMVPGKTYWIQVDYPDHNTGPTISWMCGWGYGTWAEYTSNGNWYLVSLEEPAHEMRGTEGPRGDIDVASLSWDAQAGGVDYAYNVAVGLPWGAPLSFYWGSGTTLIGGPVHTVTSESATGSYSSLHVPAEKLGQAPAGATHLVLVADPHDAVRDEADENNNRLSIPIPPTDLSAGSLAWNTQQNGLDFTYSVASAPLRQGSRLAVYWSNAAGARLGEVFQAALDTPDERSVGEHGPIHVDAALLDNPPAGATHLVLVADPDDGVEELDETNNTTLLAPPPASVRATWPISPPSCAPQSSSSAASSRRRIPRPPSASPAPTGPTQPRGTSTRFAGDSGHWR